MDLNPAQNPWTDQFWNLTLQGQYLTQHGLIAAEKLAQAAGTTVGGPRPKVPSRSSSATFSTRPFARPRSQAVAEAPATKACSTCSTTWWVATMATALRLFELWPLAQSSRSLFPTTVARSTTFNQQHSLPSNTAIFGEGGKPNLKLKNGATNGGQAVPYERRDERHPQHAVDRRQQQLAPPAGAIIDMRQLPPTAWWTTWTR
jgi:hypothetical protein